MSPSAVYLWTSQAGDCTVARRIRTSMLAAFRFSRFSSGLPRLWRALDADVVKQ
jgi:hypothetical protein